MGRSNHDQQGREQAAAYRNHPTGHCGLHRSEQTCQAGAVIPAMSPLSNVQFSRFTETEVAKILTFGSDGLLEVMVPMTDDERRDIETHLKETFRLSLSIQVKARHVLVRRNRADLHSIRFDEKPERLITDPFLLVLLRIHGPDRHA